MGFGAKQGFTVTISLPANLLRTETVITAAVTPLTGGGGQELLTEAVIAAAVVLAAGSYP